jgi:hypothetical protein
MGRATIRPKMSSAAPTQPPSDAMATSAQPATSSPQLSTIVDISSKGVAALAIALYASGFLIVSLHHSRYGFTETNPFRPKILAAGAWFFLFTGIPVVTIVAVKKNLLNWMKVGEFLFPYFIGCVGLSFSASLLFNLSSNSINPLTWRSLVLSIVMVGILVFVRNYRKCPRWVSALVSVLFVIYAVESTISDMLINHNFGYNAVTLWFFGIGFLALVELMVPERDLTNLTWANPAAPILVSLVVFALFYYPHVKPSLGGGSPINVVLYFNKDSVIKPNQNVSVQLVDESDAGFYIVGQGETRAICVPRNSVSLVYFSDKPSDSTLLR